MYFQKRRPRLDLQRIEATDSAAVQLSEQDARRLLERGEIMDGQYALSGSNHTFMVRIDAGPGRHLRAVYKPRDGERPLYDFPGGSLYKREYAAFLLARALGWPDIPLTLIRDGPYGVGSVQLYVESDPAATYFTLIDDNVDRLKGFAVFDVLANNADRKAGHCLQDADGRLWSIDHGLTFHPVFKLRTVMLEFWGAPIPRPLLDDVESLGRRLESKEGLAAELRELLTDREIGALVGRLEAMVKDPIIPKLEPRRNVPWPLE